MERTMFLVGVSEKSAASDFLVGQNQMRRFGRHRALEFTHARA
jgi:hypothetical protein